MKAIQLEKPQQFRRIEIPEPAEPGRGEVVVTVHRVGICGTDYSGEFPRWLKPETGVIKAIVEIE